MYRGLGVFGDAWFVLWCVWMFFIGEVDVDASVWKSVARLGVVELCVVCWCWCEGLLH